MNQQYKWSLVVSPVKVTSFWLLIWSDPESDGWGKEDLKSKKPMFCYLKLKKCSKWPWRNNIVITESYHVFVVVLLMFLSYLYLKNRSHHITYIVLVKVLSGPGHGSSRCCIIGYRTRFSFNFYIVVTWNNIYNLKGNIVILISTKPLSPSVIWLFEGW